MTSIVKEMFCDITFLLKSGNLDKNSYNFKHVFCILFISLLICFIVQLSFGGIGAWLAIKFQIPILKSHNYQKLNLENLIFQTIVMGPILEELCVRYPLHKSPYGLPCFLSIFGFFLIGFLGVSSYFIRILFLFFLVLISYLTLNFTKLNLFQNTLYQYPRFLLYSFSAIFTCMHIFSYELSVKLATLIPLLFLPFFVFGIVSSYIRLRLSLLHSILFHSLFNSVLTIPRYFVD